MPAAHGGASPSRPAMKPRKARTAGGMRPMPLGNGRTLPPIGKAFTLSMTTIARWGHGVMVEEWLFWDNQAFLQQIGLAQ